MYTSFKYDVYISDTGGLMAVKMKRTQIYLEPELDEDLARLAARRGVSKAQLLREGAYRVILEEQSAEEDPIMGIVGLVHSKPERVSEEHDEYLIQYELKRTT